jgi:hypothetical protein
MDAWIREETDGCDLGDRRLDQRLAKLLEDLSQRIGKPIPLACQDWAATKAAYRFLDNPDVNEAAILQGHFQSTAARFAATSGLALVLHDTSDFSFQRKDPQAIGLPATRKKDDAKKKERKRNCCSVLMHSSLVVTAEGGLPLGLAAARFWTRKEFKGIRALRGKVNLTRLPIEGKESHRWLANLQQATDLLGEPQRCVHVGDRESDIFELFHAAQQANTHFLVRTCVDRLADDGDTTIAREMDGATVERGIHTVELIDPSKGGGGSASGKTIKVQLEVRFRGLTVRPPVGKQKRYPALSLTVIHARETDPPQDRRDEPIEWKLLSDLPVGDLKEATEKLDWYAKRWKIEIFHKVLKSGCRAEDAKLRTAQRLINLLAIYCIVAWRVFWMCMINRTSPGASATLVFTDTEMKLLDHVDPKPSAGPKKTVSDYLYAVARLGGYLSRAHDAPPGNMVIWRGLIRLVDIHLGYEVATGLVGN